VNKGWGRSGGPVGQGNKGLALPAPSQPFSRNLVEQRRLASLCFRCGDKYTSGHQCKRQLLLLDGIEDDVGEEEEECSQGEEGEKKKVEISLYALRGETTNKIIKVEGRVRKSSLMILIDSRSTHSFLDEGTSKKLKCSLTGTHPLSIIVANG